MEARETSNLKVAGSSPVMDFTMTHKNPILLIASPDVQPILRYTLVNMLYFYWSRGVTVSTEDFVSSDPGSNPGGTLNT